MLIKMYEGDSGKSPEPRYSPAKCTGAIKQKITGEPAMEHVSGTVAASGYPFTSPVWRNSVASSQ